MYTHLKLAAIVSLLGWQISLADPYADTLINGVPQVKQRDDFCGEACTEMVLRKLGRAGDQNFVFNMSGLDPELGRGCYSADLAKALRRIGFQPGDVFFTIDTGHAESELEAQWKLLHADLQNGIPSIVCMRFDESPNATEHMRLVVGYRSKTDEVIYRDPAAKESAYQRMDRSRFLSLWPLKYDAAKWLVIRFRMQAGDTREPATSQGFTNADYAQHVIALKRKLPPEFSLYIQRPFVVVGDQSANEVKSCSEHTVQWAVEHLKREYFARDPNEIITIWLFKDDDSYRTHTKAIFNDQPDTPYGYYSAAHRALIMNIGTGTGTLVHEIVHPFVRANFPSCPAWLNEGLGSLYEQCGERDGRIVGHTNWRLAGLQRAIKAGSVPSFKELTATSDQEFYTENEGIHYAAARYLCYYLQEKGTLTKFYGDFVAHHRDDPTGYATLVKTHGETDMDAFQRKWEDYVMALQFR